MSFFDSKFGQDLLERCSLAICEIAAELRLRNDLEVFKMKGQTGRTHAGEIDKIVEKYRRG